MRRMGGTRKRESRDRGTGGQKEKEGEKEGV